MENKTYAIYEGNMERLVKKLTRISNKCKKFGCEFTFEEVGEEYRDVKQEDGSTKILRFVLVHADGVAKLNGWVFAGSIEHTENGNIINKAIDIEVPKRYYNSSACTCEHCKTKRYRKDTYLVMNEETGEFKQVGKSCLRDFTGGLDAGNIAQYMSFFDELIEGETPYDGFHVESFIDTKEFLIYVAETIRHFGYVKTKKYDDCNGERSTKDRASDYYFLDHGMLNGPFMADFRDSLRKEMAQCNFNITSPESIELVNQALNWLKEQPESNDYMHNLKVACGLTYTKERNMGILASLFPTFDRDLERKEMRRKEQEKEAVSEWVGNPGERIDIKVDSFKCLTSWQTIYGITCVWKIVGNDGNIYTWKTGNDIPDDIKSIRGTIKSHNEFRGVKQTELTRCKCIR